MHAPFTIDPQTGRLSFPDLPLELRPMMPEAEFIAATARLNRDNLGANARWQRYSIRQLISHDRRLGLFLIFLNGRLKKLSFAYAHKDESWATWTEQGELERQKECRAELAAQLGGKDTFPWGKIGALLDSQERRHRHLGRLQSREVAGAEPLEQFQSWCIPATPGGKPQLFHGRGIW